MVETEVLAPDTAPAETEAPVELDTAEVEATGEDTGEQPEDTRDFDKEIEEARKQAAEEARQSFESEQVLKDHRARVQQSTAWLSSQASNELTKMLDWAVGEVESGRMTKDQLMRQVKPENLQRGLAGQLASAVQTQEMAAVDQLQDRFLIDTYKDWRIPQDLVRAKEQAIASGDTVGVYKARFEILKRAVLENDAPEQAKKLAGELAQKSKTAAQVRDAKAGDRERANAEQLTTIAGGNGKASVSSMNDADREYNAGRINHDEYKTFRKKFGVD